MNNLADIIRCGIALGCLMFLIWLFWFTKSIGL